VPRTRDRHADILQGTTAAVRVYERYVRANPYQWFNFHDFWQAPAPVEAAEVAG
jgi:predicted LPLAT superfamily acyltransferase